MKFKRVLAVLCTTAMLVGLLAGCGSINNYDPLPSQMDEEEVLEAGKEVFDLLMAGEYQAIVDMLREDIRSKPGAEIKAEHIEQIVKDIADPEVVGTFEKILETHTRGSKEPELHGIAVYECTYTEKMVAVCVAFDLDMNLIGLSLHQEE
ncbi:MAG: DUF3887 domain-containing protein [Oscillospiraceae bacterium]|nr:DUF3887 domain-containing protein [Oscillospiraceae bacterium]